MRDWIIDTDCGVDDAQALILMLNHPNVNVVAITVVGGNCTMDEVTANVSEILRICGKEEIPIFKGCSIPLIEPIQMAKEFHGPDGLGGYWQATGRTPPSRNDSSEHASNAIVRLAAENPNVNVLLLGPMTNMATAFILNEKLKVNSIVAMAGCERADGNQTSVSEFNIACDPEAAKIVLTRCEKLTLATWELTVRIGDTVTEQIRHNWFNPPNTEKKRILKFLMDHLISVGQNAICDSVAAAIACDESIIEKSSTRFVEIELQGNHTRGMNVVFWDGFNMFRNGFWKIPREHVTIVERVNEEAFWGMIVDASNR